MLEFEQLVLGGDAGLLCLVILGGVLAGGGTQRVKLCVEGIELSLNGGESDAGVGIRQLVKRLLSVRQLLHGRVVLLGAGSRGGESGLGVRHALLRSLAFGLSARGKLVIGLLRVLDLLLERGDLLLIARALLILKRLVQRVERFLLGLDRGVILILRGGYLALLDGIVEGRHVYGGLAVADLKIAQRIGRGLKLVTVALTEDEQHVALIDLLPGLDRDGADLAGLVGLDLIAAVCSDSTGAADAGGDAAVGDGLRCDLRQRPVHDGVGEKGQHQQDGEEDDGGVFYPASVDFFMFHGDVAPS